MSVLKLLLKANVENMRGSRFRQKQQSQRWKIWMQGGKNPTPAKAKRHEGHSNNYMIFVHAKFTVGDKHLTHWNSVFRYLAKPNSTFRLLFKNLNVHCGASCAVTIIIWSPASYGSSWRAPIQPHHESGICSLYAYRVQGGCRQPYDDGWGLGATDTCKHLQPVSSTWGHMVENDGEWTWGGSSSTQIHCKNCFYVSFQWQEYMRKREREQASSLAIKDGAGLFGFGYWLSWTSLIRVVP